MAQDSMLRGSGRRAGPSLLLLGLSVLCAALPARASALEPGGAAALLAPAPQKKKRDKGQPPPARIEYWTSTLAAAKLAAKERNVPLLVHIILEDEPQNDEYRDMLPEQQLVRASQDLVVIAANNGKHERKTISETVDGKTVSRSVCGAYGTPYCEGHRAAWDELYRELQAEDGGLYLPQTIVFLPDGEISTHIDTRNPPSLAELLGAIAKAKKAAGRGLSAAGLREVKSQLELGEMMTRAKAWGDAYRALQRVLEVIEVGVHAERARAALPAVEAEIQAEVAQAEALLVPGSAARGYAELERLLGELEGLPFVKGIQDRLRKAEREKAIKREIAAYKLELEAEAVWREADELFAAKQSRKGERLMRRLLRAKYASTKAGQRAREAYPRWAEEEASKGSKGSKKGPEKGPEKGH